LIAAGVSASIVATIGQSQAAGNRIIERIDEVGTREIRLIDDTGSGGLGEDAVERVAALSGVEWAIGLGPVRDVQVPVLRMSDAPVPSRTVFGRPPPAIEVSSRWPDPGEAVVGARASDVLGLVDASGTVVGYPAAPIAIVGSMTVVEPVEELAGHVLVAPTDDDDDVRTVIVIVRSADEVADVAAAVLDVAGASDPSAVRVETSEALAGLRAQVDDELHRYGSGLLVSTLAAGLALTSVTSFGAVAARRRDFGRRRALGCSRSPSHSAESSP
jgi:putative ABC transport system permease protein